MLSRFPSVRYGDRVYCSEASEIRNKVGVAQKISDAELIALLCQAQHEIEAQGRSNEAPVLLADFAKELRNQRLSASVQFVQWIDLRRLN